MRVFHDCRRTAFLVDFLNGKKIFKIILMNNVIPMMYCKEAEVLFHNDKIDNHVARRYITELYAGSELKCRIRKRRI